MRRDMRKLFCADRELSRSDFSVVLTPMPTVHP
jgi:hypothetical protein